MQRRVAVAVASADIDHVVQHQLQSNLDFAIAHALQKHVLGRVRLEFRKRHRLFRCIHGVGEVRLEKVPCFV